MQPIEVYITPPGPNPWKPVLVLEELKIPYKLNSFSFEVVKRKPYTNINPNGRVPAIRDPNTGLTLWESGAIILYIIEQYDRGHTISYSSLKERHLCNQWLAFQISGQGPYFGQAAWFRHLHSEKLPTAIDRYVDEVKRILGVLEGVLAEDGKKWLVGDKMTFADLAFTTWNDRVDTLLLCPPDQKFAGFPHVQAWQERMTCRPSWKRTMTSKDELMNEQGLGWNGMPKEMEHVSFTEYENMIKARDEAEPSTLEVVKPSLLDDCSRDW